MKNFIKTMVTERGKDVNEVLDMPYHFILDLLREDHKQEEKKVASNSFFDLIG